MTTWNVYYLGDVIAQATEAPTAEAACADYANWAKDAGQPVNPDYLVARPTDEFKEIDPA